MRIDSIVPVIERELSRPLTIDGIKFSEYTLISIYLLCLNFNEEVWLEPWVSHINIYLIYFKSLKSVYSLVFEALI